jgi:uncharacterized protein YndB with AHSA1/START domain
MPDILHDVLIRAPAARVFQAVSTPEHLDQWWTTRSAGQPTQGAEYELRFGPQFDWRARVTRCVPGEAFEFEMVRAGEDWTGTRVGFRLASADGATQVRFDQVGWPKLNEHYRVSCYCWAMYLRVLKRYLEHGERVPYEKRLDV